MTIGNNPTAAGSVAQGAKETRKVVGGYGTTTIVLDAPLAFNHVTGSAVVIRNAATASVDGDTTGEGTNVTISDNGRYVTQFPGVYEAVDVPDPEQAFEPRYVLGGLTNRNFYEMYKGQETLSGSIGSMVIINGYPLRFPIGKVITTPVHSTATVAVTNVVTLGAAASKGDIYVNLAFGTAGTLKAGEYLLFGINSDTSTSDIQNNICANSFSQHTDDGSTDGLNFEIRQIVNNASSASTHAARLNAPLSFDHVSGQKVGQISKTNAEAATARYMHSIIETTTLDSITWNVSIPDSDDNHLWQRRYIGGKVGSMSVSAEEGGLLTVGWDGVQFLDMLHNIKNSSAIGPSSGSDSLMPRYSLMSEISKTKVGKMVGSGDQTPAITFSRPSTEAYYFSQGTINAFGTTGTQEMARIRNFALNVSNGEEPKYYIRKHYEGRRTPFEIFEGNREYTMSATIATPNSEAPATADSISLWRELLLTGDYRTSGGGFRGFGVTMQFDRNTAADDYIKFIIPDDGTAAIGGNEQGAFIRTAPHNIGTDNPIQADADIQFRSLRIQIKDNEPMYP